MSRLLESTVSLVNDVHFLYCCICPSFFLSFCRLNSCSIVDTIETLCVLVNHGYMIYFCFILTMEPQRPKELEIMFLSVLCMHSPPPSVFTDYAVHNSCFSLQSLRQINRATEECDWAAVVIYVSCLALRFSFAPVEFPQSAQSPCQGRSGSNDLFINGNGRWCSFYLIHRGIEERDERRSWTKQYNLQISAKGFHCSC